MRNVKLFLKKNIMENKPRKQRERKEKRNKISRCVEKSLCNSDIGILLIFSLDSENKLHQSCSENNYWEYNCVSLLGLA